jgi:hypothetical protein
VFPWLQPFAAGHGPTANPRRGVVLAFGIALCTVALGNLNVIAPLVSMFFLISYGLLNFATYYEARAESPSFRPTFRWHDPRLSLAGALACGAVIVAIDPMAGAVAGAVLFGILQYVRRTVRVSRWATSGRSLRLRNIRENLIGLSADPEHPRDWRPIIVAFSEDTERRVALLRFAAWIEGGSGFVSVVRVLDEETGPPPASRLKEEEERLRLDIAAAGVHAFPRCVYTYETRSVLPALLGAHGLGEVRANTVLLNRLEGPVLDIDDTRRSRYGRQLRTALRTGCNLIVLDAEPQEIEALDATPLDQRRIDVWYANDATGTLCLLLAYLTTRTDDWKDAVIRLIAPRYGKRTTEQVAADLTAMLENVRIEAEAVVAPSFDPETRLEFSGDASLVFLPFTMRGNRAVGPGGLPLAEAGQGLSVVAFAMAMEELDLDAEPEEGRQAEIAEIVDRADEAEKAAREAEKRAEAAVKDAAAAGERVESGGEGDGHADRKAETKAAEQRARTARRAAERAREKAEQARAEADAATGQGDADSGEAEAK